MNSSVLYKTAQLIHEIWEMADEVGIFQVTKRIHDIIAQWGELISEGEAYRSSHCLDLNWMTKWQAISTDAFQAC